MKKQIWGICLLAMLLALAMAGCGGGESRGNDGYSTYYPTEQDQKEPETEFKLNREADLYVLEKFNQEEETIQVYRISNGLEYQYKFDLHTEFVDKYEDKTPSGNFIPGKVVELKADPSTNILIRVRMSDQVWEYTNVENFSLEDNRQIFYIARDKYYFDENTKVYSNDELVDIGSLSDSDKLTVYGQDKKILAIIVTTGHGELQLMNTVLFEGSYLQLGSNIFSIITPNMKMEVQEGTYTLAVANDGWGGTCEVEIARGQVTEVDLDQIKGDGPKYGTILFEIGIEGATLLIDNKPVDYSIPLELRYGWHTLTVSATGYDDWSKKLYVNSDEATITIALEEKSTATTTGSTNNTTSNTTGDTTNNTTGDTTENTTTNGSTNTTNDDYLSDYLSTLTDLIGSF